MRCQMDEANAKARDPVPDPNAPTRLLHYPVSNFFWVKIILVLSGTSASVDEHDYRVLSAP